MPPLYEPAAAGSGSPDRFIGRFVLTGKVVTVTNLDGAFVVPLAGTITEVRLFRRTAGSGGSTTVDVNKNGTTIFTTQGNRPSVTAAGGNNLSATGTPDVTSVSAGDRLEVDIDAVETGNPLDITITVTVTAS